MENTMKKNTRMSKVSLSRGTAAKRAVISTFRPLILVIVLRGRITLNDLSADSSAPELPSDLTPTSYTIVSSVSLPPK